MHYNRFERCIRSPEYILALTASSSDEKIKEWHKNFKQKFDFCETMLLLDDNNNKLTQKQYIRFLDDVGFSEYIADCCVVDKNNFKYRRLYETITNLTSEIDSYSLVDDSDLNDDNGVNNDEKELIRDRKEIYYSETSSGENEWFDWLNDIEEHYLAACIVVKCIIKDLPELVNHVLNSLTINIFTDDDDPWEIKEFLEFISKLKKNVENKAPKSIIAIESLVMKVTAVDPPDLANLREQLKETCTQLTELFMKLAPIPEIEENIEKQKQIMAELVLLAPNFKERFYENGIFPGVSSRTSFHFYYNSDDENKSKFIDAYHYAAKNGSISLLQFLFDRVPIVEDNLNYFVNIISSAVNRKHSHILPYLLDTLLNYLESGTITPRDEFYSRSKRKRDDKVIDCKDCVCMCLVNRILRYWFSNNSVRVKNKENLFEDFLKIAEVVVDFGAIKKGKHWADNVIYLLRDGNTSSIGLDVEPFERHIEAIYFYFREGFVDMVTINQYLR